MIEFVTAQNIAEEEGRWHMVKKKKNESEKTELWMLFAGSDTQKDLSETIWKTVENAYFKTVTAEDPYDRFEEALKVVNKEVSTDEAIQDTDFYRANSILLGVFSEETLHIAVVGNAEVYLLRKHRLIPISDGLGVKKFEGDLFVNIASGEIHKSDSIVFASERLLRYATASQLVEMVAKGADSAVKSITELLHLADTRASFLIFQAKTQSETLPLPEGKRTTPKKTFSSEKGASWWQNIKIWYREFMYKFRRGEQKSFLAFMLGVLALLVIIISLTSLSGQSQEAEYEQYKVLLNNVQKSLKNVEDLETLGETEMANANLSKIERDLKDILASNFFRSQASTLFDEVSEVRDRINNITRIKTPPELANLKSRKNEVQARGVFAYNDEWYAFDANTLFRILLKGVENVLPLSGEYQMQIGVPLSSKNELVFLDTESRVFEYDMDASKLNLAKTADETWKKGVALATYTDNVYMLSPEENQIWKYERREDNFGNKVPYLAKEYDISSAISLAIDGDVFVFTSNGELLKFFKGFQEEYEIVGASPEDLKGVTQIYTDQQLENLLLLNPEKSTVYVLYKGAKQAEYVSQIVFENVGTLQGIWAKAPKTLVATDEVSVYIFDF